VEAFTVCLCWGIKIGVTREEEKGQWGKAKLVATGNEQSRANGLDQDVLTTHNDIRTYNMYIHGFPLPATHWHCTCKALYREAKLCK
jgi:hypothetical protein